MIPGVLYFCGKPARRAVSLPRKRKGDCARGKKMLYYPQKPAGRLDRMDMKKTGAFIRSERIRPGLYRRARSEALRDGQSRGQVGEGFGRTAEQEAASRTQFARPCTEEQPAGESEKRKIPLRQGLLVTPRYVLRWGQRR